MPKFLFPLTIGIVSLTLFPNVKAGSKITENSFLVKEIIASSAVINKENSSAAIAARLYENMGLGKIGLSAEAFQHAIKGYQYLVDKGLIRNSNIITVCDFSQISKKKRMYIIDVKNEKVLINTYVAHGKNSGFEHAKSFSNTPESLQSSLGFYITKGTYFGKHGLSLRLDGREKGFNDKAEERAVVMHGADYIGDHRLGSFMGRSFGCPAVPRELSAKVINLIKDGTCLFIYHPSNNYIQGSKIINS